MESYRTTRTGRLRRHAEEAEEGRGEDHAPQVNTYYGLFDRHVFPARPSHTGGTQMHRTIPALAPLALLFLFRKFICYHDFHEEFPVIHLPMFASIVPSTAPQATAADPPMYLSIPCPYLLSFQYNTILISYIFLDSLRPPRFKARQPVYCDFFLSGEGEGQEEAGEGENHLVHCIYTPQSKARTFDIRQL